MAVHCVDSALDFVSSDPLTHSIVHNLHIHLSFSFLLAEDLQEEQDQEQPEQEQQDEQDEQQQQALTLEISDHVGTSPDYPSPPPPRLPAYLPPPPSAIPPAAPPPAFIRGDQSPEDSEDSSDWTSSSDSDMAEGPADWAGEDQSRAHTPVHAHAAAMLAIGGRPHSPANAPISAASAQHVRKSTRDLRASSVPDADSGAPFYGREGAGVKMVVGGDSEKEKQWPAGSERDREADVEEEEDRERARDEKTGVAEKTGFVTDSAEELSHRVFLLQKR